MSGAHNLYRPRCTCCGRFCRPADEGTPFGGPQDMEPPDEEFWCAPCVEVEVAFYVRAAWCPQYWLRPAWVDRVAKVLGLALVKYPGNAWSIYARPDAIKPGMVEVAP